MIPAHFTIAGLTITTYTVMFALGGFAAMWVSVRLARLSGMDRLRVLNVACCAVVGGAVGAMLPGAVFRLFGAEPGMLGGRWTQFGMVGAFTAGAIAARWHHIPVLQAFDVCACGAALSHALGRVGCFAAGCCWGAPFHGPWAVTYHDPLINASAGTPIGISLHPTQLYEAITEAMLAVVAYRLLLRPHRRGAVMGTYLLMTSLIRFGIEFLRAHPNNEFLGAISLAQWMSMAGAAVGAFWLYGRGWTRIQANSEGAA